MTTAQPRILITGALGQIGTELVRVFRSTYGETNVLASDIKTPPENFSMGPFKYLDVLNAEDLARTCRENRINLVVHLASILSALGEQNPQLALKLNTRGTENVLELAHTNAMKVFIPSSIAAFGPSTPRVNTPDECITRPTTIYGITKVYTEQLGDYYHRRYGVDFRSLRYPGIVSSETLPGGGTTDYAIDIYIDAVRSKSYTCFLKPDSMLPMLYMPDCIKATIDLIEAPSEKLTQRTYNVTGMSFSPTQLAESIRKFIPEFTIQYQPDSRQDIADTWPQSIDDSIARRDWSWSPDYDIDRMTKSMLKAMQKRAE